MKRLSVIMPCYNEEKNIKLIFDNISMLFDKTDYRFELVFINDGSKDKTLIELKKLITTKLCDIKIINFSRKFGTEEGMYAGLQNCTGEYAVIIDADMQQNPKLILDMLDVIENNDEYDSVAFYQEKRNENIVLALFKNMFYKLINKISEIEFVSGASDFRLINRNMIDNIVKMTETNRFSKGIFSWIGFNTYYLPYKADNRVNGSTNWSFWKLFKYAMFGIMSFSNGPLRLATLFGVMFSVLSFIYLVIVIIQKIMFGIAISGYATIVVLILLLGGIQLLVLGIIGEYLAKAYTEIKHRPIYIAKEIITNKEGRGK